MTRNKAETDEKDSQTAGELQKRQGKEDEGGQGLQTEKSTLHKRKMRGATGVCTGVEERSWRLISLYGKVQARRAI